MASSVKPKVRLSKNKDGTFTFSSSVALSSTKFTFAPGIEFEENGMNGRKSQSVVNFHGNIMNHVQRGLTCFKVIVLHINFFEKVTSRLKLIENFLTPK